MRSKKKSNQASMKEVSIYLAKERNVETKLLDFVYDI